MANSKDELAAAIGREASAELTAALQTIEHCLGQLTDEQLWWRPAPDMNSIGNLLLHLCGNVAQWIVAGVGGTADTRNRPKEFAEQGPIPKTDLLDRLTDTVSAGNAVLNNTSRENLLSSRRIQGFDVTGLTAIVQSVAHFRGHTQEIVHITRCQLGERYLYRFIPQTPEQGAPVD